MNIVKIADIAASEVDESVRSLYEHFKNLYCYCINWKYIVTFDDMETVAKSKDEHREQEVQFKLYSQMDNIADALTADGVTYAEFDTFANLGLIDSVLTRKVNLVSKYIEYNNFNLDDKELTIEQVKKFRTWLATELYALLSIEHDTEEKVLEMLDYYANEMTDDTIKHLSDFSVSTTTSIVSSTAASSSCSCTKTAAYYTAANSTLTTCDPVAMYKKALYQYMVEVFSNIDFWTAREDEFITEMKKYIDAIIKLNLPLTSSSYVSELFDCNCLTITDSAQDRLMSILKNLSTALGYIINDEVSGHKNFIGDTLYEWSSKLYEIMRW